MKDDSVHPIEDKRFYHEMNELRGIMRGNTKPNQPESPPAIPTSPPVLLDPQDDVPTNILPNQQEIPHAPVSSLPSFKTWSQDKKLGRAREALAKHAREYGFKVGSITNQDGINVTIGLDSPAVAENLFLNKVWDMTKDRAVAEKNSTSLFVEKLIRTGNPHAAAVKHRKSEELLFEQYFSLWPKNISEDMRDSFFPERQALLTKFYEAAIPIYEAARTRVSHSK